MSIPNWFEYYHHIYDFSIKAMRKTFLLMVQIWPPMEASTIFKPQIETTSKDGATQCITDRTTYGL